MKPKVALSPAESCPGGEEHLRGPPPLYDELPAAETVFTFCKAMQYLISRQAAVAFKAFDANYSLVQG